MRGRYRIKLVVASIVILAAAVGAAHAAEPSTDRIASAEQLEFFEKRVRPLLVQNCHKCHGPEKQEGNLRLDSRTATLKGGDSGPVIVPGRPDRSELVAAINYGADSFQMPPTGKLSEDQIRHLTEWIRSGAAWPADERDPAGQSSGEEFDLAARAGHWSFQPVQPTAPPRLESADWVRTPIDCFVLKRLEQEGLQPAPPADKRTLLRRVTYDLVGLPPTREEIESFLNDDAADAFDRVIERLLASPRYGERWGRHWLDLVRYAETRGHEFDFDIPYAWVYRDYVVRALNQDLPYDQFVVEHVAGDLVDPPRRNTDGTHESIKGTAFYWFSQGKHSPVDIRAEECDRIDNQLDVLGKTMLGLTIACARCHDHKFDPIRSRDYYALAGYLQSSRQQWAIIDPPEPSQRIIRQLAEWKERNATALFDLAWDRLERRATRLSEFLLERLTTAEATGPASNPAAAGDSDGAAASAEQKKSSDERAARWRTYLTETAARRPSDLFHAWAVLSGERHPQEFDSRRRELLHQLNEQAARAEAASADCVVFDDFRGGDLSRWFVAGPAFAASGGDRWDFAVSDSLDQPIRSLIAPDWRHSGLLSGRFQGTLHSETFRIDKRYVHYRVHRVGGRRDPERQNKNGQINVIVDGFQLIRYPLYGNLSLNIGRGDQFVWYRQDLSKFIGSRAYIEIIDDDDGSLVLDKIVFSDDPAPPESPHRAVIALLADPSVDSPGSLAAAYEQLLLDALSRRRSPGFTDSPEAVEYAEIINSILANDLFDERPPQDSDQTGAQAAADLAAALDEYRELAGRIRRPQRVIAAVDGTAENEDLLIRGNHLKPGAEVPRRFLEVLGGSDQAIAETGSGRLHLARQMVDPANPLTARVIVNRLWHHHFGAGIVPTPDDFGRMGQPPSHPELLDFLAAELVRSGWSLKSLHRMMLSSSVYRMSSRSHDPKSDEGDPTNRLLHKMRIQRLEGEIVRDALLALSGRLDSTMTGPSVPPYLTEFMEGRGRPKDSGPLDGDRRRSLYLAVRRNFLNPLFLAFDYPTPMTTMGRRSVSNVPAQALTLMNNPLVRELAQLWAQRLLAETATTPAERITWLYETAFSRPPSQIELDAGLSFLDSVSPNGEGAARSGDDESTVDEWTEYCHVLINLKEFIYIH